MECFKTCVKTGPTSWRSFVSITRPFTVLYELNEWLESGENLPFIAFDKLENAMEYAREMALDDVQICEYEGRQEFVSSLIDANWLRKVESTQEVQDFWAGKSENLPTILPPYGTVAIYGRLRIVDETPVK